MTFSEAFVAALGLYAAAAAILLAVPLVLAIFLAVLLGCERARLHVEKLRRRVRRARR